MATTEEKKQSRTYAIVGAIVVVVIVAISIGGVLFMRSSQGRALQALADAAERSEKRPGAQVLRAQGCRQVIVLSYDELRRIGMKVGADGDPASTEVMCIGAPAAKSCDELARTFAQAEADAISTIFHLTANDDDDRLQCSGYFDAKGAPMGKTM